MRSKLPLMLFLIAQTPPTVAATDYDCRSYPQLHATPMDAGILKVGKLVVFVAFASTHACSSGGDATGTLDAAMADVAGPFTDSIPSDQQGAGVSFVNDVYPIVVASCAVSQCHDTAITTNHWTNLSTAESTYMRWVNGPGFDFCTDESSMNGLYVMRTIVVPGDPEGSFLMWKIAPQSDEPCQDPTHSRRMPPAPRPPLAAAQIGLIETWIREGARQN